MIFKKKFLLLTFFLIIILQTFLYVNNNQKTSFRYFKWTLQEVSIGKLINISFFSGLLISTLLTTTISSYKKNVIENIEENYEPLNNQEDMNLILRCHLKGILEMFNQQYLLITE